MTRSQDIQKWFKTREAIDNDNNSELIHHSRASEVCRQILLPKCKLETTPKRQATIDQFHVSTSAICRTPAQKNLRNITGILPTAVDVPKYYIQTWMRRHTKTVASTSMKEVVPPCSPTESMPDRTDTLEQRNRIPSEDLTAELNSH